MLLMSWQFYTAVSVFGLSISIILQRLLLNKHKTDPVAYSVTFQAIVAGLLLITSIVNGFSLSGISDYSLVAIICVISYGIGTVKYAKTLQKVEASAFSMLFATHAVWVMALGIVLFDESLTSLQLLGSVLIFSSVVLLSRNISSVFSDKGTLYGLLTGLIYGIAITCWAYVGRSVDTLSWAAVSFVGSAIVSLLISPSAYKKIPPMLKGAILSKMVLLGIFYAIGSFAMLLAYKYGTLILVSPLRQTGIIVTTLLALALLKSERNRIGKKVAAALISFIGVVLLVI